MSNLKARSEFGEGYKMAERSSCNYSTSRIRQEISYITDRIGSFDDAMHKGNLLDNIEEIQLQLDCLRKKIIGSVING